MSSNFLPDGNGLEVCERIKAARPAFPVVLISAIYRTADAQRDGYTAGADAYLVSPDGKPAVAPQAVVRTTPGGGILWVNDVAARLLNVSERGASGRSLLVFFNGERTRLLHAKRRAVSGQVCEVDIQLRPRERKPITVRVDLSSAPEMFPTELEWVIEPV